MITNRHAWTGDEHAAAMRLRSVTRAAAAAGIDLIQVRERDLNDREALALCEALVDASHGTIGRVVVNRRLDLALLSRAAGVHLPASSPAATRVRRVTPSGFLIGRSVHSAAGAVAAEQDGGCDYLIFGTVFPSTSKPEGHAVAGLEELQAACSAVRLPVLAIGGVSIERVPDIARAGAAGIAAIGLFSRIAHPDDPLLERRFVDLVQQIRDAFDSAS